MALLILKEQAKRTFENGPDYPEEDPPQGKHRLRAVANRDVAHTDLFALSDDLGINLPTRLPMFLVVIRLDHVQSNR